MTVESVVFGLGVFQAIVLLIGAGFLIWLVFLALPGLLGGPPFLSARRRFSRPAFELADLQKGETIIDLGSGDGRLLLEAADRGCRAIGYEINLPLVWLSRAKTLAKGRSRQVEVRWQNFFKAGLPPANAVLMYCTDQAMVRLAERLKQEMPHGTRVVTLRYPIPGWTEADSRDGAFLYRL